MTKMVLVAAALLSASVFADATAAPVKGGIPARQEPVSGLISLSLIEALTAVKEPGLAGVFTYISEANAPTAFADYLARDTKALSRYLDKLDDDRKAANGLTDWDHQVCATLVNFYASPAGGIFGRLDAKRSSKINQCVLVPVVTLGNLVAARKK